MKSHSIGALGAASFATTRLQFDANDLVNVLVAVGSSTNAPNSSNTSAPAPGAFALVGIARLAGGRRRLA